MPRSNIYHVMCSARSVVLIVVVVWGVTNTQAEIVPGSKNLGAIWFIGDSITQSNADQDPNGSPRLSVYNNLMSAGFSFSFTGQSTENVDGLPTTGSTPATDLYQYHSGVAGAVIDDDITGHTGIAGNLPTWWNEGRLAVVKPNVILIMIGTNDVNLSLDLPNAPARLSLLLNTIYALPGIGDPSIFLSTIPPNRIVQPTNPANVAAFNAALPGIVTSFRTSGKDVTLVDNYTPLNDDFATAMIPGDIHPNSVGNALIGEQWSQAIEFAAAPEPSVWSLFAMAALGVSGRRWRQRQSF